MKLTRYLLLLAILTNNSVTAFAQFKTESVLADGDIYKISFENTGIYKIDYSFFSSQEGIDINAINPKNISIYALNGGVVAQSLSEKRVDDLEEIPIYIKGEGDLSFDPGDYILVFFEGADRYKLGSQNIEFEKNPYSLNNYAFIKVAESEGKRITLSPSVSVSQYSNTTESIRRHETERLNLLGSFGGTQGSGKRWFGESFANEPSQDFSRSFEFPKLVPGTRAEVTAQFAARSSVGSAFELNVEGNSFERSIFSTNTGNIESVYARIGFINDLVSLNSSTPHVSLRFLPQAPNSEAWLDYIQIIAEEFLNFNGQELHIFRRDSSFEPAFGYTINTSNALRIWDVSNIHDIREMESSFNGNSQSFSYETDSELKQFWAFREETTQNSVEFVAKLNPQNLHGLDRADLAIVYYGAFEEAAQKLADHRRSHSNMAVVTADVEEIYNEFGGGRAEPTAIRDFVKMLYDRDPNFRYLLLLGDASYDFRGLNANLEFQNFVPTYETEESLNPIEAFPSDDFYALLSDNEGDDSLDGALDIGVGRIPCKSLQEANGVVNKIISYDTNPKSLGEWRMRTGFAADDEDNNIHMRQADGIATLTENNHPELNQQKVYFDAYNQESTPGGARYPDARSALVNNIQNGQLVLNYLGHGGPKGWAQERVLQLSDLTNLNNFERLPILVTATCSFTGFDEPNVVSAGELALLNPGGGAIALFSTVRAVYSSQNERITREVFKKIFTRNTGERQTLGDIIQQAQNSNSSDTISSNTRKFMLFGDPSQTIALPQYRVEFTELNGTDIHEDRIDTLGALSKARVKGHISDYNGVMLEDFNGDVFLTVFDKASTIKTLDNDNKGRFFEFSSRKNTLYKGSASVVDGRFEIEFIIPKDINFEYGKGLLSFYASDNTSRDAGGYYDKIIIGGTSEEGFADNEGPLIQIFFNNRSFVDGGETGKNAIMIVDLEDENGINLSGTSIGHDITAVFDGNQHNPIILNGFYNPTPNKLGAGTVVYDLINLDEGRHTVTIKAWDILNNSSEKSIDFVVIDSEEGFIKNLSVYPNPAQMNGEINFCFEHDLVNTNIDVTVELYDTQGRFISSSEQALFSSGSKVELPLVFGSSTEISNGFGNLFEQGILFYKIKIESDELNLQRESNFEKLILVR